MNTNFAYHAKKLTAGSVKKIKSQAEWDSYKAIVACFGLENPYTTTNIVLARRKQWDESWNSYKNYNYVMGIP